MATHSSVLAWRIPGTGEPGGLPSMGSHRVGHDWSNLAAAAAATWGLAYKILYQFSRSVMSNSLWPHGLQHTRPPCPSSTPEVSSNSSPFSQWCHPTISSSVILKVSFNFMAAVTICSDFRAPQNKVSHCFHCFPIYLPWSDGTRCHDLSFWMLSFKPTFSLSSFTFIKRLFSSSSLSAIRVVSSAYLRLLIFLPAI